jgi:ABC-type lipoprotein export system ATPase subunit
VETRDLIKIYGDGVGVHALDGISVSIPRGQFVAIIGPSGAGKSTLLHMLGALDRPSQGEVIIAGQSLGRVRDLDRFRNRTIGFIFQMHNLIPTLTALENIEVPMAEAPLPARRKRERARELLKLVGLEARRNHLPNMLSGGERQRVAIARSLANQPAILLADEPTGNLDSKTTDEIMDLLATLNREQGMTLIVVTHNSQVAGVAERVLTLRDGKIESDIAFSSPYEKDLIDLKHSQLGRAILTGSADLPVELVPSAEALRRLLAQV